MPACACGVLMRCTSMTAQQTGTAAAARAAARAATALQYVFPDCGVLLQRHSNCCRAFSKHLQAAVQGLGSAATSGPSAAAAAAGLDSPGGPSTAAAAGLAARRAWAGHHVGGDQQHHAPATTAPASMRSGQAAAGGQAPARPTHHQVCLPQLRFIGPGSPAAGQSRQPGSHGSQGGGHLMLAGWP